MNAEITGPAPERKSYVLFDGPNGDSWYLQEVLGAEHPGALITRRELVR